MEFTKDKWSQVLRDIRPTIKGINFKGDIKLLTGETPKLAIVGTRRITDYGSRVIERWMPALVQAQITIVSGFMYGVDQAAHKACIDNGGKTIAVLGWGIDREVGGEDENLYQKILQVNSLILSEYPGNFGGTKWTFPERNRIVAGISDAVLVVEAAEKSGSLITARLAVKMKKTLLAVPGRVDNKLSWGTNYLIKTCKALAVTEASDILRAMDLERPKPKPSKEKTNDPLLLLLETGEKRQDEIGRLLKISVDQVAQRLTILTLMGEVEEKNGKYFKLR